MHFVFAEGASRFQQWMGRLYEEYSFTPLHEPFGGYGKCPISRRFSDDCVRLSIYLQLVVIE